jgi:hypothetical protein
MPMCFLLFPHSLCFLDEPRSSVKLPQNEYVDYRCNDIITENTVSVSLKEMDLLHTHPGGLRPARLFSLPNARSKAYLRREEGELFRCFVSALSEC